MDNSSFHACVFALKPNQPAKPSTYWVAVLKADLKPSTNLREEDFLWIKCNGGIKVGTVLDQYRVKNKGHGKVKLKLGNKLPGEESMRELDEFNDQLLAFEAVKISELPSRISNDRLPLQPTNRQVKSEVVNSPTATIKKETGNYQPITTHLTHTAVRTSTPTSISTPTTLAAETSSRPNWTLSNGFLQFDIEKRMKLKDNLSHQTEGSIRFRRLNKHSLMRSINCSSSKGNCPRPLVKTDLQGAAIVRRDSEK